MTGMSHILMINNTDSGVSLLFIAGQTDPVKVFGAALGFGIALAGISCVIPVVVAGNYRLFCKGPMPGFSLLIWIMFVLIAGLYVLTLTGRVK